MAKQIKGILGAKLGMTQVFDENNRVVPVTVVKAGPCVVTQVRTPDTDGYSAVQLAFGALDPRKANKPTQGHFRKAGVPARRYVRELRTADASEYTIGQEITADLFEDGAKVDVTGVSKGKGTAGVIKRHNFKRGPKTHGSDHHRAPGSIGPGTTPGRVYRGMKMSGHMGDDTVTIKKVRVVRTDPERNLLLVKGSLPGARGGLILVKKA
jgi:large subunit ribosomal protein L3